MDSQVFKSIKCKKEDDQELKDYVGSVGEIPLIEDFDGGRRYYNFPKTGMNLVLDESTLKSVQLFSFGVEENTMAYQGELPHNLNFLDSMHVVLKKLGGPNISKGGVENDSLLGNIYPWCKYIFDEYSLRVEFEMDRSKIRMISLADG